MRKKERQALRRAFAAPPAQRKAAFLQQLPAPTLTSRQFVLGQTAYIRKGTWLASVGLFAVAWCVAVWLKQDVVWLISALFPFVAVTAVIEGARADMHGMTELEMAARFSHKSVLLARMTIVGALHVVLLCLLSPLCWLHGSATMLHTGAYLLAPYLLTTVLGLHTTRKLHGKEAGYVCLVEAALVSVGNLLFRVVFSTLFLPLYADRWLLLCVLLAGLTAYEYRKQIDQTEELVWN
ncbi:MAG: hypothetical protein Q4D42_00105 [Eubacteriales bacterium]|nr:hypothetical protein [Eubacteriales bacterium]